MAVTAGAEGIGLLRTEFLYMNRQDLPGKEEQYKALTSLIAGMGNRPITVRTLDIGGDKLAVSLEHHIGQSANPAPGLRALRPSLKLRSLLETQPTPILRPRPPARTRAAVG